MRASDVCAKAAELVGGEREAQHGTKIQNFSNIARLWDAYLRSRRDRAASVSAADVAHMMILLKVARTQTGTFNADDLIDAAGYSGCAAELATT